LTGALVAGEGILLSPAESQALWLSLLVALRSVAFSLPFAVLVAWVLSRARFPGKTILDGFVHLPLVLPPVVVGYLLLLGFGVGWRSRARGRRLPPR
jgi:molybdate transport system permease protein